MKDENGLEVGDEWAAAMEEQVGDDFDENIDPDDILNNVQPAPMEDLISETVEKFDEDVNINVILDIPVDLSMEIGRTRISIRNLLQLNQGSIVELDRLAGEPLDVMVNGTLIAHGEVVVVNERFGIRLTDVISPAERVKKLK